MIEYYKKPTVKFIVNKGNFNKLMGILTFQEENIITQEWKESATKLKELLLRYSLSTKRRRRRNINYRYCIIPKGSSRDDCIIAFSIR